MKTLHKYLAAAALAAVVLLGSASVAFASNFFATSVSTAAATTTPAYMTPGNATTTITYNTYTNNSIATATPSTSVYSAATSITFLGQITGSSTSAVIHITPEYSVDGMDWYQGYGLLPQYTATTTNQSLSWATVDSITIPFASTTVDQTSSSSIDRFAITIAVPTKDVRLVVTLTGANAAFWGTIVPTKVTP
jgi:hypothetical protein